MPVKNAIQVLVLSAILLWIAPLSAQIADFPPDTVAGIPVNYTEANVGEYTLPALLQLENGKAVKSADVWMDQRRAEIVKLIEENQFGRCPEPRDISFEVHEKGVPAFDGKALRTQVTIHFTKDKSRPKMDLVIYLPPDATGPVPLLLNISFSANELFIDDDAVRPGMIWNREHELIPASQGRPFGKLDVVRVVEQGIGIATFYYGDVDPDFNGGFDFGVRKLYLKPGQTERAADEWGSISAWGWGISCAIDYFETDDTVDEKKIAIYGISRLGKTVMWEGGRDPRVAMVIASCSGEGGAALSRRDFGETVAHLTEASRFPYQFAVNYQKWGNNVNESPVDAHMLVALIAPRPVLLITGNTDKWSDPYGEFLAAVAAEPVYELLGKKGLGKTEFPPAGEPILHDIGYYMHDGGHGPGPGDWDVMFKFIKMHLQ